ncbi:hypothetical protein Vretifemale_17119, partial [Volvox reticuliferus]
SAFLLGGLASRLLSSKGGFGRTGDTGAASAASGGHYDLRPQLVCSERVPTVYDLDRADANRFNRINCLTSNFHNRYDDDADNDDCVRHGGAAVAGEEAACAVRSSKGSSFR